MADINYMVSLSVAELLAPALIAIRGKLRQQLEEEAQKIIEQEVTRYALQVSEFISIQDIGKEIRVTIQKHITPSGSEPGKK